MPLKPSPKRLGFSRGPFVGFKTHGGSRSIHAPETKPKAIGL
jgi:hypothetical protein